MKIKLIIYYYITVKSCVCDATVTEPYISLCFHLFKKNF